MGEERGERPDGTDPGQSPTDDSTGDGSLEPTGGPQRVVSEESVDDVVASLNSTKTTETNTETDPDRTDVNATAPAEPASDGSNFPPSTEDVASTSQSPPQSTDELTSGLVDLDDLSDDAGPLAGRLQTDSEADGTQREPDSNLSVEPGSTTNAGDAAAESGVDERDRDRDADRAAGSTRADDPAGTSGDAPDDDDHASGLLARIKRLFFD